MSSPSVMSRLLLVFLPFALAYVLSYLYRTVNAVIADELSVAVGVSAAGLGVLTSAYFVAFGAFQVPLGLLLDRYGPRRVEAGLLLVAAVGAAVFAMGEDLTTLIIGRALIGLGVSACLMAALTANVIWWPRERLPLLNGLFIAFGGLGAVFATTPVRLLMDYTDWRGLFFGLAVATAAAAVLLFTAVPERGLPGAGRASVGALLRGTADVFRSPLFWRLAPASGAIQGVFMAYIALWAGPWLRDVDQLDPMGVASHLQYAAIGMVLGYAAFGLAADLFLRIGIQPLTVQTTGMVMTVVMQVAILMGWVSPIIGWPLYTFFSTSAVMGYAVLSQRFPAELAGRVNTAVNLMMFAIAFSLQTGIGAFLSTYPPVAGGGYSPEGHWLSLLGVILLQAAALIWQIWPRRP